jgi:hypothetical protein
VTCLVPRMEAPPNVKDAGDLLLLRDCIFEELGPPYMYIIMLSVVEWDTLTDAQKGTALYELARIAAFQLQQSLALRAAALALDELKRRPLVRELFLVLFYWCLFTCCSVDRRNSKYW